ncbi:hypothetical protein ABIB14_003510 [Arthrobacter sp. UYEF3]
MAGPQQRPRLHDLFTAPGYSEAATTDPGKPGRPSRPSAPTLGDLGQCAFVVPGKTPPREIGTLFREDRTLRAVVVDIDGLVSLLTRDQLDDQMTGRLGYGRALNTRGDAAALRDYPTCSVTPRCTTH